MGCNFESFSLKMGISLSIILPSAQKLVTKMNQPFTHFPIIKTELQAIKFECLLYSHEIALLLSSNHTAMRGFTRRGIEKYQVFNTTPFPRALPINTSWIDTSSLSLILRFR